MPLVDELQHAQEIFFEGDGNGQDGLRSEAALLVPSLIEAEIRRLERASDSLDNGLKQAEAQPLAP